MTLVIQIIFWLSIGLIFHSYVLFPLIMMILDKFSKIPNHNFNENDELPKVSILLSIYNEEDVIAEKIESIFNTTYPTDKIELIIGSDNSTDKSNEIVAQYAAKIPNLNFFPFYKRNGKQGIINQIFEKSNGEIIFLTDANVIFDQSTIFEVVKYFKNLSIGLVDTCMINKGLVKNGISIQESAYITREVLIKNQEGNFWGTMMGPFGGCYAIRRHLYIPIPTNFLVDDFFINMSIFEKGYKAINNNHAKVYEDVSNDLGIEFKRKIRIATGNFQNLSRFKNLLLGLFGINTIQKPNIKEKPISIFGIAFCFLSHKVLRWLTPFLILTVFVCNILLLDNELYLVTFILFCFSLLLPLIDLLLKKINIHLKIIRFITHFYVMNLALLIGFFRFLNGVKSGVWQPTKRNQTK